MIEFCVSATIYRQLESAFPGRYSTHILSMDEYGLLSSECSYIECNSGEAYMVLSSKVLGFSLEE